ncbi:MAG: hypothetical protein ABIJ86_03550 [Spirochaetota bacterium]
MDFTKMTGAGNDFIVLEVDGGLLPGAEVIRLLCDRRYGIGADGLMIINPLDGGGAGAVAGGAREAFSVDFYNADGSGGMLCGNGARCALVYAAGRGFFDYGKPVDFTFAGRLYSGTALDPDSARFMLDPHYTTRLEEGIKAGKVSAKGRYVDLGSLHLVVDLADLDYVSDGSDGSGGYDGYAGCGRSRNSSIQASRPQELSLDQLDVAGLGAALRNHTRFAPEGVNVSFCSLAEGRLHIRTFERGVEGETLACGTGSTASALSYALRGLLQAPVHIMTRGSEELIIDFDDPAKPSRLSLEGPAKTVFEGQMDPAYFLRGA